MPQPVDGQRHDRQPNHHQVKPTCLQYALDAAPQVPLLPGEPGQAVRIGIERRDSGIDIRARLARLWNQDMDT